MEKQNPIKTPLYFMHWYRMILAFLFVMSVMTTYSQVSSKKITYHGDEANAIIQGAEFVKQSDADGFPSFVRLREGNEIDEKEFFGWLAQSHRTAADLQFLFEEKKTDELGITHTRYVQAMNGIPIDQSHFILHSQDGKVYAFNGNVRSLRETEVIPSLTADEALKVALEFVGAALYKWQSSQWEDELKVKKNNASATYFPEARLVIHLPKYSNEPRLAYLFDISALSPMKDVRVCVDATDGRILYDVPMESNCDPATVNTIFNGNRSINTELYTMDDYRLRDDCTPAIVHVRDWNSNTLTPAPAEIENTTNTWTTMNEIFGGTTLWCVNKAYGYFLDRHSRDGYDDANGDLDVYINALFNCAPPAGCTSANNASMSFSTQTMKVGLSSAGVLTNSYATIDIIGHEYAHAVTASSAGLIYEEEWGALNESFSDIFGEAAEFYTFGSNDWLLGEERDNGAIRSMSDPNDTGDPDTYLGTNWLPIVPPCDGSNDQCGVHRNSGVQNFWFYLVSEGGSGTNDNGDDFEVNGIGILDAEAIAYRNLVMYLGPNSDYSDARDGSIQAAIDLFGVCSEQTRAVTNAWYAVGVGDPFLNVTASVTSDYNGADVTCFGADDGEATAVADEGTGPYTFLWSNGDVGAVASDLAAGTYTVTVTDAIGCTAEGSVTLTNPPMLSATISINSDYNGWPISCFGACDGVVEVNPVGGTGPYDYEWSEGAAGQTTKIISGLCAGIHTVVVTDANGCSTVANVALAEPPPLEIEAGQNQTIFYYDISMACTTLMGSGAAGGVPPYTYEWSSGGDALTEDVCLEVWEDTITIVTYYLTITDANGCQAVDSLDVCYVDINCGKEDGPTKVTICHIPPDNPLNPQTLCVGLASLVEHLFHGDQVAECGFVSPCGSEEMPFIVIPGQADIMADAMDGMPMLEIFPNPVTEQSTIRFILHDDTYAELLLFDMHGRELVTLYQDEVKAGMINDVSLQSDQLSAGIYLVRLIINEGENQLSRKIILR